MPYVKPYAMAYPLVLYSHPVLCGYTVKTGIASPLAPCHQSQSPQSPSRARFRPVKAPKSRQLGQRIGRQLRRLLGPLFKPHQNGANGPVDSMVKRVVLAQCAHAHVLPASTRA